jgi:REP element-mobilizing transposase RayT
VDVLFFYFIEMEELGMGRKPRNWQEGVSYHIMVRGNHKEVVFRERGDYLKYCGVLYSAIREFDFQILSLCLMPNHVHLQVRMGKNSISDIMRLINHRYTLYFNRKYGLVGHLFQGRFKAVACGDVGQEVNTNVYIHRNPGEAGMVVDLADYEWSSYGHYIGRLSAVGVDVSWYYGKLIAKGSILAYFEGDMEVYRKFVEKV